MTSAVGNISTQPGGIAPPVASVPSAPEASATSTAATPIRNPRVIQDPTAGFITEYLTPDGGQVLSQTPSAVAIAYMRLGIAPGTSSETAGTSVATTA